MPIYPQILYYTLTYSPLSVYGKGRKSLFSVNSCERVALFYRFHSCFARARLFRLARSLAALVQ